MAIPAVSVYEMLARRSQDILSVYAHTCMRGMEKHPYNFRGGYVIYLLEEKLIASRKSNHAYSYSNPMISSGNLSMSICSTPI